MITALTSSDSDTHNQEKINKKKTLKLKSQADLLKAKMYRLVGKASRQLSRCSPKRYDEQSALDAATKLISKYHRQK